NSGPLWPDGRLTVSGPNGRLFKTRYRQSDPPSTRTWYTANPLESKAFPLVWAFE
ncbi:hypothetical protein AVEN_83634-1, partial [Araneus ventricosus]